MCGNPGFFMFFGGFHLHRIWALFDREAYALFWMGIMQNKGIALFPDNENIGRFVRHQNHYLFQEQKTELLVVIDLPFRRRWGLIG